jgi:hypothetical protein
MSGILDRHKYSPKTIENFEIISAYYIDIFYNHLYLEAKKLKINGKVASITEGYKHTLNAFLKSLNNPKLYKKSIVGIHNYYITIGYASISFSKCVDKLTKEFVPSDYYNSLTVTQKMGVLRMVINQAMKVFIRKIVDEHMIKIIDYHKEVDNVRILQDELIDCFILEREGMYQRFIAENTKTNKNETVNRLLAEKMQQEIKRLIKEKYEQQKNILVLKKLLLQKNNNINKLKELLDNTQSENSSFKKDINLFKTSSFNKPSSTDKSENNDLIENSMFDEDANENYIEVNNSNIGNIINSEPNNLHLIKMDNGTLLEDFS